jgi:arylformamidase
MRKMKNYGWIDVSVPLYTGMVHWPGDPEFHSELAKGLGQGDVCNLTRISTSAHIGTHMDAPRHFIPDGEGIDQMPIDAVVGLCRVIEIKDRQAICPGELDPHRLRPHERILFKTRNSEQAWQTDQFIEDFVYISKEAAQYLAERRVKTVGVDYLSVGGFATDGVETHQALLGAKIWIIEGLNLSGVKPGQYELVCLPIKLLGSDGAPARAILRPVRASSGIGTLAERLSAVAEEEVQQTVARLPDELRQRAQTVPIVYDSRSYDEIASDGAEDTLGLFVGANFVEAGQGAATVPAEIILYLENIWFEANFDEALFRKEVRTTYLHELGHYLGLEELDLQEREL